MFAVRVVKCWKRHPREAYDALCLSVLKRHLDGALSNMLSLFEVVRQSDLVFIGSFPLHYSVVTYSIRRA